LSLRIPTTLIFGVRLFPTRHREGEPNDGTSFVDDPGSLLGQKKYAEAEPLILSGYEGMKTREASIPPQHKPRLTQATGRVVKLYEAWGKPDKAAKWRKELKARKSQETDSRK
jgi:eukaryotic-like serine/threonine-protein kinase